MFPNRRIAVLLALWCLLLATGVNVLENRALAGMENAPLQAPVQQGIVPDSALSFRLVKGLRALMISFYPPEADYPSTLFISGPEGTAIYGMQQFVPIEQPGR